MILSTAKKAKLAKKSVKAVKTTKLATEAKKVRLALGSSSGCTWG